MADEVRKLSLGSATAAKDVSEILNEIKISIENINEGLSNISESANYQAQFTEDNTRMIEQLSNISINMKKYIEKMK